MYARGTDVESTTLSDDYLLEKSLDPACVQDEISRSLSLFFFSFSAVHYECFALLIDRVKRKRKNVMRFSYLRISL